MQPPSFDSARATGDTRDWDRQTPPATNANHDVTGRPARFENPPRWTYATPPQQKEAPHGRR